MSREDEQCRTGVGSTSDIKVSLCMGSPGRSSHSKTSTAAQDPSCLSSHLTAHSPCVLQSALKGNKAVTTDLNPKVQLSDLLGIGADMRASELSHSWA